MERRIQIVLPPVFSMHAEDVEAVLAETALMLCAALRAAGLPAAMRGFEKARHGSGLQAIACTPFFGWTDWSPVGPHETGG